jgi:hypothetical protein
VEEEHEQKDNINGEFITAFSHLGRVFLSKLNPINIAFNEFL